MSELILTWSVSRVYPDTRSKKGMLLYHLLSQNYNTWRCCCLFLVVVLKVLFLLGSISASGTKTTVMFMSSMEPMKIHSAAGKCHGLDQLRQTAFDCLSARCVLPWLSALRVRHLSSGDFKEQIRDFRENDFWTEFPQLARNTTLTSSSTLGCVNKSCVLKGSST